jgi:hypothetical protein
MIVVMGGEAANSSRLAASSIGSEGFVGFWNATISGWGRPIRALLGEE